MAAISGKTGTIDGVCGSLTGWEVTLNTEMLDATDFCSGGWMEVVAGLKSATGTITSNERYTGSSSIILANSAGGVTISGNVLWHEETISNQVDGLIEYSQGFTFNGEVTIT